MRALRVRDNQVAARIGALDYAVVEIEYCRQWRFASMKHASIAIVLSGVASKAKVARNGGRLLLSFGIPLDILTVETLAEMTPNATIEAITPVKLVCIATAGLRAIADDHPEFAHAAWVYSDAESRRAAGWIANLSRQSARERLAYILCELTHRQEAAGLGDRKQLVFAMSQPTIADAIGITPVHLSRTFSAMVADGLLTRPWPCVGIPNWPLLAKIGEYLTSPAAIKSD